ncbi:MAG: Spy/CpxP family protein refolding chaperone [Chitinophagales bacterium]|nr:Spy/CpxP family protein refolding chaperone [Chitinophagales bacterium]
MKKIFTLLLFTAGFLFIVSAQPPKFDKPSKEKIEALKIGFITQRLDLTEEQAQKFWPIYNQFEAEKKALRKNTIGDIDKEKPIDEMTEAEVTNLINKHLEFKTKDVELTKKYIAQFKTVLNNKQVAKLITAEDNFKKMLINHAKPGEGPPPPPNED